MARQEKKTRIKGLPPKLLLDARAAHTGSYPPVVRAASDNRTGKYNAFWDDNNTVVFSTSSQINLGTGVPSYLLTKEEYQQLGSDMSSSLYTTGNIIAGISDDELLFTPGQKLKPFEEHSLPGVNGKQTNNPFYATGSSKKDFGEGFSQPLWDKTKIEIDLTPSEKCSIQANDGLDESSPDWKPNHYMAYWNKDKKIWESICDGKQFVHNYGYKATSSLEESVYSMIESASIGFAPGIMLEHATGIPGYDIQTQTFSYPIQSFGFPFHQKYHATSSNLIQMSDYITKPFLLEKIVLQFSASLSGSYRNSENLHSGYFNTRVAYEGPGTYATGSHPAVATTFFILNQKKNKKIKIKRDFQYTYSIGGGIFYNLPFTSSVLSYNIPDYNYVDTETNEPINTTRDLISYGQICTIRSQSFSEPEDAIEVDPNIQYDFVNPGPGDPFLSLHRELTLIRSDFDVDNHTHDWNINTFLSFSCKSSLEHSSLNFSLYVVDHENMGSPLFGTRSTVALPVQSYNSFRDGFSVGNRDFKTLLRNTSLFISSEDVLTNLPYSYNEEKDITNPYYLFPEDNLIFGWQLPIYCRLGDEYYQDTGEDLPLEEFRPFLSGSGYKLEWDTAPQKIVLYGSYIKEGKEYHDTLNQLLINDNVHEIIGED